MNKPTLKRINLSQEQTRAQELERAYSGEEYTFLKDGWTLFAFKEGRFAFRFVTQPDGAREGFALTLPHIYIDPNNVPGMRGYLPLTVGQAALLDNVRRALYNSEFKDEMSSETNRNGISLGVKFKTFFVGLLHGDIRPKLYIVAFPSNGFTKPKKGNIRLQCGTAIVQFAYDANLKGEPKYPNLFDLDEGRLIVVEVTGSGDRTEYTPSVDIKFPLDETYYDTLSKVPKFEDIVNYQPDTVVYRVLRKRLPSNMWDYVVNRLQLQIPESVLNEVPQPAVTPKAATGEAPRPKPAATPPPPPSREQSREQQTPPAPPQTPAPEAPATDWSGKSTDQILKELQARGIEINPTAGATKAP